MTESYYIISNNGELYHHGVKGMKWGVRRDARLLANSRRNQRVRAAQAAYKSGKLTKDQRNKEIEAARQDKKKTLSKVENDFAKAKTDSDRSRLERDLANKTTKEVPRASLKRGASVVNALFGGMNAASIGVASASMIMINPAFAGVAVASAAVGIAAEAGYRYVVQLGLDKLS